MTRTVVAVLLAVLVAVLIRFSQLVPADHVPPSRPSVTQPASPLAGRGTTATAPTPPTSGAGAVADFATLDLIAVLIAGMFTVTLAVARIAGRKQT